MTLSPRLSRLLKAEVLAPLALMTIAVGLVSPGGPAAADVVGSGRENYYVPKTDGLPPGPDPGRQLYIQGCSSCHGLSGEGTPTVPSLVNAGAAAVDFYVSSGRMPLDQPMAQAPRKKPRYNRPQIDALASYVASLGGGPPIPAIEPESGNLAEGQELYANNCAACHNSNGSGGSVGRSFIAPALHVATPLQAAEAMRTGPGTMPVFGENTLSDDQVNSILKYIEFLDHAPNPGGLSIGHIGPVAEGFIAWIVGLGLLLGVARWIGTRV